MSDFTAATTVTARTPKRCEECGTTIPGRSAYVRIRGRWEGEWFAYPLCLPCGALWPALNRCDLLPALREEVAVGELRTYLLEAGLFTRDEEGEPSGIAEPFAETFTFAPERHRLPVVVRLGEALPAGGGP